MLYPDKNKLMLVTLDQLYLCYFIFQENFDIDIAWQRGVALMSSVPICLRTVCLLCGSAGQHEVRHIQVNLYSHV